MVLRNRLEQDPYSLTKHELIALQSNDEINKKIALASLNASFYEPAMKTFAGLGE